MILVIEDMFDATSRLAPYGIDRISGIRHDGSLTIAAFEIFYYLYAIHDIKCFILSFFHRD